jgi:hypothetical protein
LYFFSFPFTGKDVRSVSPSLTLYINKWNKREVLGNFKIKIKRRKHEFVFPSYYGLFFLFMCIYGEEGW